MYAYFCILLCLRMKNILVNSISLFFTSLSLEIHKLNNILSQAKAGLLNFYLFIIIFLSATRG